MLLRMRMNKKGQERIWSFEGLALIGIIIIGLLIALSILIPRMLESGKVASSCRGTCSDDIDGNTQTPTKCPSLGWESTVGEAACKKGNQENQCCISIGIA